MGRGRARSAAPGAGLNAAGIFHGSDANPADIDAVVSTDPSDGGDDQITLGAGQAIVVGGQGNDTIVGGTGTNVILGDSGMILAASTGAQFGTVPITVGLVQTTAPGIGGVDHITTGTGGSIVFGGTAGDVIKTDQNLDGTTSTSTDNTNFIFGDDGYITWVGTELNPLGLGAELNASGTFTEQTATRAISMRSSRPIRPTAATTRSPSAPARRSSSAARATTRSPAARAPTSSSATAA